MNIIVIYHLNYNNPVTNKIYKLFIIILNSLYVCMQNLCYDYQIYLSIPSLYDNTYTSVYVNLFLILTVFL